MGEARTKEHLTDSLASIAYFVLDARGQTDDPSHGDVAAAVVRSAELLDLYDKPDSPDIYIAAINQLAARHNWKMGAPVEITHANGFDHKAGTTTPRRGDPAGR